MALQFHPDRYSHKNDMTWENANQRFAEINEAYENLIDWFDWRSAEEKKLANVETKRVARLLS